jgi:LmbE family N-acetylglucosaminyl deacetylase
LRKSAFKASFGRIAVLVAIGTGTLTGLVLFSEIQRRQDLYGYEVTADYRYTMLDPGTRCATVRLSADGFVFPECAGDWDTALLQVTIRSTGLGTWFEPAVHVLAPGGVPCQQHFERKAAGVRYLDLCLDATEVEAGVPVRLQGRHVTWDEQDAQLLLFSSAPSEAARLLVLAPHADDAEIAAFGLYSDRDTWVVTVTNGSYGGDAYRRLVSDPVERDDLQAALRRLDTMVGTLWAGLAPERGMNLGYFTLALETMYGDPKRVVPSPVTGSTDIVRWRHAQLAALVERSPDSTWDSLVADLVLLLSELRPDVIVLPHPALDSNRDHVFTAAALLEALEQMGDPALTLLLYTNHHVHSEYYPFGPADAVVPLPPWFDETLPVRSIVSHRLDSHMQLAKLFALDAMHDLRPPPEPVLHGPARMILQRLKGALADVARDPARELSYFRRAPRPNELFFAHPSEDRARLQELIGPSPTAATSP